MRTLSLAASVVFFPGLIFADETDPLPDVVVTADADGIQRTDADFAIPLPGGRGFQEILPALPNVQQGTPSATSFAVRGVGYDNVIFLVGTQSNVLVNFSDGGVPATASSLSAAAPLLWDVEAVELTRGPILFGRGAAVMGGELRLEPRAPQFVQEGKAMAEIGSFQSWRAGLTENMVLIPDKLALRLNASGEGSDGNVVNIHDGNEEFAATQRSSFRGQLRWRPGGDESSVFDLRVDVDRGRGNFFGQSFQLGPEIHAGVVDLNTTTSLPADRHAVLLRGRMEFEQGRWWDAELSYSNLDGTHYTDFDGSSLLDWFYLYTSDERRFTASTRFGQEGQGFRWLGGIYAESSEYGLSFEGRGLGPVPVGRPFTTTTDEDVDIAAIFGQGELELGAGFWVHGGVRLDYQAREQRTAAELGGVTRGMGKVEVDHAEWLPELGTEWRGDTVTAGIKISRSYRPGGAAVAPSLGVSSPYGPERGWEINAFTRKEWDCLKAEARVFHAWLNDAQVPYIPPGGFPVVDSFISNSGKAKRSGAEVEMRWETGDFSAGVFAGYLHAEYERLVVNGVKRDGQNFPLAPEWTAGCGIAWNPVTGWFGETSLNWADTSYAQIDSPVGTKLESRMLWSARTGYRWERVEAYVFGSNLLDEDYALSKNDYSGVGLPVSGKLGVPRIVGTGVTLRW